METRAIALSISLCIFSSEVFAVDTKSSLKPSQADKNTAPINEDKSAEIPGDHVLPPKASGNIDEIIKKARETLEEEKMKTTVESSTVVSKEEAETKKEAPKPIKKARVFPPTRGVWLTQDTPVPQALSYIAPSGEAVTVFSSNAKVGKDDVVTLPSGSHAFGRAKFGEEVTASGQREIAVELDYAFLGPNESVVEMTGCVVWFAVTAYSVESGHRFRRKPVNRSGQSGRSVATLLSA